MDVDTAQKEIRFIHEVVARTHRRIDPHAFHFVHWGLIVLVWYPAANWMKNDENLSGYAAVGILALVLGFGLSAVREMRMAARPRVEGENTFITRQVTQITAACIAAGAVLSGVAPAFGFIDGPDVPIIWGLVYANLAFMTGVVYNREFLWAGVFIFVGVVAAIVMPEASGYILGPFMALGMIVPGLRAAGRVRRMRAEERDTTAAQV
jgi:hypothetical protein